MVYQMTSQKAEFRKLPRPPLCPQRLQPELQLYIMGFTDGFPERYPAADFWFWGLGLESEVCNASASNYLHKKPHRILTGSFREQDSAFSKLPVRMTLPLCESYSRSVETETGKGTQHGMHVKDILAHTCT